MLIFEPVTTEPLVLMFDPATTEPLVLMFEPVTTEPLVLTFEPVITEPLVLMFEPVTTEPLVLMFEPVTTEPLVLMFEPVTTEPLVLAQINGVPGSMGDAGSDNCSRTLPNIAKDLQHRLICCGVFKAHMFIFINFDSCSSVHTNVYVSCVISKYANVTGRGSVCSRTFDAVATLD